MLIGIDMISVQSPGGGSRESSRLGRQFVAALLAADSSHRFVLYTHEGLPTDRVPTARRALRVSLSASLTDAFKARATLQRVLDRNPDGLDWLILLDPFDPAYGGWPPESPLNGLKVASIIADLDPSKVDDRRLAPLRDHDAILTFSEAIAADCRRRLPTASHRVRSLGLAIDESWASPAVDEPLGEATANELGRLGIEGPFLFANLASGADRSNLGGVLDAYRLLPIEHQKAHQLVIAGRVDDPWSAISYLHDHGCADGLVMVGPAEEPTLRLLYGRCSAFVSPGYAGASALSMVEAMRSGTAIVGGRDGAQTEILGDAGLLADPHNPSEIAERVVSLLDDIDLRSSLRKKARDRSSAFVWGPVIGDLFEVLSVEESTSARPKLRFDRAHGARPRIAVLAALLPVRPSGVDIDDQIARVSRAVFDVDSYYEPGDPALFERTSVESGGFDARQFGRNDAILDYQSVVYILNDVFALKANLGRLANRPGLVILRDETSLGRLNRVGDSIAGGMPDVEAEVTSQRLQEFFLTESRLGVRSSASLEAIRSTFPEFADRVVVIPPFDGLGDPASTWRSLVAGPGIGWPTAPYSSLVESSADALSRKAR